jgi:hypothetical protein
MKRIVEIFALNDFSGLIQMGLIFITVIISLAVGIKLRHNAKAHEKAAQTLDKEIERANLRRA